jgi:hypothetical protein
MMSTMIFEVYDALKEAGASEEKAKMAAEAVAAYDTRFASIDKELAVLKWMVSTNIALSIILVGLLGRSVNLW